VGVFIGIDPGKKGGWAVLGLDGSLLRFEPMPESPDLVMVFDAYKKSVIRVWIEKAQAMPGQGVTAMFNYGTGFGKILGQLEALRIPHQLVTPQKWQKNVISGTRTKDTKKDAYLEARRLWPEGAFVMPRCRKPHDGVVDAALIAEYGRRQHVGG
jgi:hypothetical protein